VKTVPHMFMPTETINGIIKKVNQHSVTSFELETLMNHFNEINGCQVPRPGQLYRIPMLDRIVLEIESALNKAL